MIFAFVRLIGNLLCLSCLGTQFQLESKLLLAPDPEDGVPFALQYLRLFGWCGSSIRSSGTSDPGQDRVPSDVLPDLPPPTPDQSVEDGTSPDDGDANTC